MPIKIAISPYSRTLPNGKPSPKNYPFWGEVVKMCNEKGCQVYQFGLSVEERITGVHAFMQDMPLADIIEFLNNGCASWIAVDNFFPHLAEFSNVNGVVIWGFSDPRKFGWGNNLNIVKSPNFFRHDQFAPWDTVQPSNEIWVSPESVICALSHVVDGVKINANSFTTCKEFSVLGT